MQNKCKFSPDLMPNSAFIQMWFGKGFFHIFIESTLTLFCCLLYYVTLFIVYIIATLGHVSL